MAIWQFDCNIIPFDRNVEVIDEGEMVLWDAGNIDKEIIDMINKILPEEKSWSETVKQYGNNEETCFKLYFEKGKIEEIVLRLDLRCLAKGMLSDILEIIKKMDAVILYDKKIFEPEIDCMISVLKNSNAGRFSISPEKYFDEICNVDCVEKT